MQVNAPLTAAMRLERQRTVENNKSRADFGGENSREISRRSSRASRQAVITINELAFRESCKNTSRECPDAVQIVALSF